MTILHQIGEFLRNALGLVPLPFVRGLFVAILIALLVWVLMLPNSETTPPGSKATWSNNLKIWAALALVLQVIIYSLF